MKLESAYIGKSATNGLQHKLVCHYYYKAVIFTMHLNSYPGKCSIKSENLMDINHFTACFLSWDHESKYFYHLILQRCTTRQNTYVIVLIS
jgi:hypothetical protein